MPIDQTQKPRFYEGQFLSADDLAGILEFSAVQGERHAIGAHTWGIAMGFELKEVPSAYDPTQVSVFLQPGYGWDGFGRPIVALAPYQIPADRFRSYTYDSAIDEPNGRLVEVWLGYREIDFQPPQPGFQSCDAPDQNSRVQETFEIYVGTRATHALRHNPVQVANYVDDAQKILQKLDPSAPLIYDESIPQQTLPGEASAMWLLPIGFVRWKPNPSPAVPGVFMATDDADTKASNAFRIYIGVVAAAVEAASGVIRLKDRKKDYTLTQSSDLVWVEGDLRAQGHINFTDDQGGANGVPLTLQRLESNATGGRDLQIVIGTASAGKNHLAIGPLNAAGTAFKEKVTIQDDGKVGIGTTSPQDLLHVDGGNIRWANGSQLKTDQGGSIELGGNDTTASTGTPYIDFHFKGTVEDFNVRLINDDDGRLTVQARVVDVTGKLGVDIADPARAFQVGGDSKGLGIEAPGDAAYIRFGDMTGRKLNFARSRESAGSPLNVGATGLLVTFRDDGSVGIRTDAPAEALDVRGNVKLHADGSLFAPGGVENLRVIRGTVDPGGNIFAGSGFTVNHVGIGLYEVTFAQPFIALPSASATQIYPGINGFGTYGMSTDNAVINGLNATMISILTGNGFGIPADRFFSFIVVGPR